MEAEATEEAAPAAEATEEAAPAAETTEATEEAAAGEPAAGDDLLAAIQEQGVIRVSTDPNYAPQSFLGPDGEFQGFDVDVAREIAARLGVEVEFVTPDWDIITAGNWGDQWDMSVGSMTVTTARQQVLDFASPPYYYTPAQFAAAEGSGIESIEDITGQTVCVGVSTTYETWLNGDLEALGLPEASLYAEPPADVTVFPLTTDNECVQSIQAGREEFQVLLTSNTVVEAGINSGAPIQKVGSPVFSENLAVAFDKNASLDNSRLVEEVSQIITEMHADGTLSELSLQWFEADLTQDPTMMTAEPTTEAAATAEPTTEAAATEEAATAEPTTEAAPTDEPVDEHAEDMAEPTEEPSQ
jgi:polar amino acid transport system substrate-binding protein